MNRFYRYAVAATVLAGVLIASAYLLIGGHGVCSIALADVAKAVEAAGCIKSVNKNSSPVGSVVDWYSFKNRTTAGQVTADENTYVATFSDYNEGKEYAYTKKTDTITITKLTDKFASGENSVAALIAKAVDSEKEQGAKLVETEEEYEGKKAIVWTLTKSDKSGSQKITIFVAPDSKLPFLSKAEHKDGNGKVDYSAEVSFEYPDSMPTSIYDLDVPQSAKVEDRTKDAK